MWHLSVAAAKQETAARGHFNQPTNSLILATVRMFCSRLRGTKSGYFEQTPPGEFPAMFVATKLGIF